MILDAIPLEPLGASNGGSKSYQWSWVDGPPLLSMSMQGPRTEAEKRKGEEGARGNAMNHMAGQDQLRLFISCRCAPYSTLLTVYFGHTYH
jgi:hypothetical protein